MVFSIPQPIHPVYTLPPSGPVGVSLNVGTAIKDMPQGADTTMKRDHNFAVIQAKERFDAAEKQYENDFQLATQKATTASNAIGDARKKKIIAITILAASIIAIVGTAIALGVSGLWPVALIAVPFLMALVPTSYYTHLFRKLVSSLENDIQAPGLLPKPVLTLPVYNPKQDLDLLQSRIDAQNILALGNLKQLAESKWSNDQITNYALLDRVTPISMDKRPQFYAKCIQLIDGFGLIMKQHTALKSQADHEFQKMDQALKEWKRDQDSYISSQEWTLREQERQQAAIREARLAGRPIPVYSPLSGIATLLSRWELEKLKTTTAETYGRRDSDNRGWYRSTLVSIETTFQQASNHLEMQYSYAKAAAV